MKRKFWLTLLSVCMAVSLLIGSVSLMAFGEEESKTTWSACPGGVYEGVTYANPANDFWLGRDVNGKLFYQTEAAQNYQILTDGKYYVNNFSFTVSIASTDSGASFNEGNTYIIGLSNVSQGMPMAGIKFTYTAGEFAMSYCSAGLNLFDFSEEGAITTVAPGAQVKITFVDNNGTLQVFVNDVLSFIAGGLYPSFQGNPDYTFPANDTGYYGYFALYNNYHLASGSANVNNRITFHDLQGAVTDEPDVPDDPKEQEPSDLVTELDANVTKKTWSSLAGGVYESQKYGDLTFGHPNADFYIGEDAQNNLVYDSVSGSYNAQTGNKAYVNGFKMRFMLQSLDGNALPKNSAIYIGLSNLPMGQTMAAIKLLWTGRYFEMYYASAGLTNLDGNELSTYSDQIGHIWLGQTNTFEFKEDTEGNLQIWVNGVYAFTTGYYPSFNGLADYTFPHDDTGYYGYFSVHNNTVAGVASATRITFYDVSLVPEEDDDYEYDAVDELIQESVKQTYSTSTSFEGVSYHNLLGNDFWFGKDVQGNLFYQAEAGKAFTALSTQKAYLDGFTMSFMIQQTAEGLEDGAYFIIGLSQLEKTAPMASIYLVWSESKQAFNMYYISAGFNGDGGRLDTYSESLHRLHLGEKVTFRFVEAENGLKIYMNGIYTFTTVYYPSFQGNPAYTFPQDNYGYYGYFGLINSCAKTDAKTYCGARVTFYELTTNGFASGTDTLYDADDSSTYASGTTIGSIANDFVYRTLTSGSMKGNTLFESGSAGAFSFAYTDKAVLNAFGMALNASHSSVSDTPAYSIKWSSGSEYLMLTLEKASDTVATVKVVTAAGSEILGTIKYDWRNQNGSELVNLGLFINSDTVVLSVGAEVYTLGEKYVSLLAGFEKNGSGKTVAAVEVLNEVGNSRLVVSDLIFDGTAVQKKVARAINTTLADLEIGFNKTFTNPYTEVEVLFYDGSTETFTVTWDESAINNKFAAKYTVSGTFEGITPAYYFSEPIKEALTFKVSVAYDSGYVKFGTTEYAALGSIWDTCGGGDNHFLYRENTDGTTTFTSDGYATTPQFMPATTKYRDLNGYTLRFTENRFNSNGMLIVMFLPENKHPVEFGTHYIALTIATTGNGSKFYVNFNGTAGNAEAYLKNEAGECLREVNGGSLEKILRVAVVSDGTADYVKFYLTVGDTVYEVVTSDGSDYKATGTYLSSFTNGRAYVSLWNEQGAVELTFKETYTKYVTSFTEPSDTLVDFGSEHGLPTEIELMLNNGDKITGTITWTGDYNKEQAGQYKLKGTISYDGSEQIGNGTTIFDGVVGEVEVTVTVREEVKIIQNFTALEEVKIKVGDAFTPPAKFTVTVYSEYYDTTTEEEIEVVWSGSVNALVAGTYTLTAQPVGSYAFADNISASSLTLNVVVEKAKSGGCGSSVAVSSLFGAIAVLGYAVIKLRKK